MRHAHAYPVRSRASTANITTAATRRSSRRDSRISAAAAAAWEALESRRLLANVVVFDNSSFVDTTGGSQAESDAVQASLVQLGHAVTTFTDFTDTGFSAAVSGKDILLIPEQENGQLGPSLSAAAKTVIQNFVNSGKGLI